MTTRVNILALSVSVGLFGCGANQQQDDTQEIVDNLVKAGFPIDDIEIVGGEVYTGRDADVTLQASREMLEPGDGGKEQYRTVASVLFAVTKICILPTSGFQGYSKLNQGLDLAIENYNALGLRFIFARLGLPATDCSAVISARTTTGTVSSAGFPSGGFPYGTINISTELQSFSVDVNEHVITHELGHTIGLRHSDYFNRSISCGTGGDEGSAGVGAVLIPGTPSTASVGGSVMNSCPRSTETGEFTDSDVTALTNLYGRGR